MRYLKCPYTTVGAETSVLFALLLTAANAARHMQALVRTAVQKNVPQRQHRRR